MTRVTSGRTYSEPFASYDQDLSSWRMFQDSSSTSASSSVTWPRSGSMRSGQCFERPKLAPLTSENDCSSLRGLPTPTARDWKNGKSNLHGKNARPLSEVALVAGDKFSNRTTKWEQVIGRQQPPMTLPDGAKDSHQLNAKFALWMQAADDLDLAGFTRKQGLMAAGNAVNHVQAEAAVRGLLQRAGRTA